MSTATAAQPRDRTRELNLFLLTWPIFLEIFLFMLMGIADTFMLSALSDRAVSGVGASHQYMTIALLILEVIGNGASIVVAQYIGARNYEGAARISALSVTLSLIVGLVMSTVFLIFSGMMMEGMNLQGETLDFATSYLGIVGGALFLQALINSMAAIVRVNGFTKEAMFVSLGMNVVHIVLNYMLIFGNFGAPELGVQGAAISSVVSRALAVIVFFWLLYRVTRVRIQIRYYFNLTREYVGKIMRIGIPSALEQVMYHSCQLVFLYYATYLGDQALSARQYAQNISMFIFLFAFAVGIGTSIIVGRLVGANRNDEAYVRVWRSTRSASLVSLAVIALVVVFRHPLISMFTDDPEVIRIGTQVLLYSIVLETGRTINIILVNSLRASGDAKYPLWIGIFTMIGISVPLGYLLVFKLDMGLPGIWLAIASDEWLRAIIMYFRWKSRKWERYALVKRDTDGAKAGQGHAAAEAGA